MDESKPVLSGDIVGSRGVIQSITLREYAAVHCLAGSLSHYVACGASGDAIKMRVNTTLAYVDEMMGQLERPLQQ